MVLRKELTEIFRDRGTLIILLIPLFIFPILNIGIEYINQDSNKEIDIYVKYDTRELYDIFNQYISDVYNINTVTKGNPEELLKKGYVDCYIYISDYTCNFIYNSNSYKSLSLTTKLSEEFRDFYNKLMNETNEDVCLINLMDESGMVSNTADSVLSIIIPIVLVTLLFQNTSCFANDMFSGEKERKTLELLLLTNTKKVSIYFGKALALMSLSLMELLLSLGSYFLTFGIQKEGLTQFKFMINGNVKLNVTCIVLSAILLSFISVFMSLTVSLVSKNMKNSQLLNEIILVIPVGTTALLVLGVLKNNNIYSYVPVLNLLVNFIEAFSGNINITDMFISLVTNIFLLILIVCLSVRYMKSEKIL